MRRASAIIIPALLAAASCQEPPQPGESRGSTTPRYERPRGDPGPLDPATRSVRIGELGPNFAACAAVATTRDGADSLLVRAAPFEAAAETGFVPGGARFFVCSRSLDQQWFGIVYGPAGADLGGCEVARPVPARRDYGGPCASGWVASAGVKVVAR